MIVLLEGDLLPDDILTIFPKVNLFRQVSVRSEP